MIHSNPKILPGKIIHQLENIAPEPTETKYDLNCRCNDGSTLRSPHCPQEFLHVSNKSLSLKLVQRWNILYPIKLTAISLINLDPFLTLQLN